MSDGWDGTLYVYKERLGVGYHVETGRVYYLAYDANDMNPGGGVCNLLRGDGHICRLPVDHDGPHMPFAADLVVQSGMYVTAISPDPTEEDE